jgi:hypothetical protein
MTFAIAPEALSISIRLTATPTTDESGVEYQSEGRRVAGMLLGGCLVGKGKLLLHIFYSIASHMILIAF